MSAIRQNYHVDAERGINTEINNALQQSYTYLGLAQYFDRDDVALENLHKFFLKLSEEKKELVHKLIKYQNIRGGRVMFSSIERPLQETWGRPLDAIAVAINVEKAANVSYQTLHDVADRTNDPHLSDFIEEELLEPVVENLKKLGDLHTNAKRCGDGLGEYVFNKESFE